MKSIILIGVFIGSLNIIETYRILGIIPETETSHFVMFEALFRGLVRKGHEVDVVSHYPLKTPISGYNDLSIRGSMPMYTNNISIPFIIDQLTTRGHMMDFIVETFGLESCELAFNTTVLKELKHAKKKYDLVITEIFGCDCMLGFGHIFKVPVISMTTSVNFPWGSDRIGLPDNPSYIPNYFVPFKSRMTLLQRLENTIILLGSKFRYSIYSSEANSISRRFFGDDLPDLEVLAQKTNLILVNSHFSVDHARPSVPNFIEVAGLHIQPVKSLPKHLEDAINVTPNLKGVIYLSFGSMILSETLPIEKLMAFFETFRELPYKVLWKASKERFPKNIDIPQNIHFESWMPQLDILCHPNTKLFISHGGLMGTQEALQCGVPRIGIPFVADQELNVKTSEAMGISITINYHDLTKDNILRASTQILETNRFFHVAQFGNAQFEVGFGQLRSAFQSNYSRNAKEASERFKDRPLSSLDTAIYWVEYVIRHKGAPHLRSVGADLPWYQYYLLDVGAILLIFTTVVLVFVKYLLLFILRIFYVKSVKNGSKKTD